MRRESLPGGANGANRLSGNALPEAMVFGERAGESSREICLRQEEDGLGQGRRRPTYRTHPRCPRTQCRQGAWPAGLMGELKDLMWRNVGAFRTADALAEALDRIRTMRDARFA